MRRPPEIGFAHRARWVSSEGGENLRR